ncbi:MAG: DUF177 domain-containing protein [Dehalococcoidia bacterium]|nr:DUF177 domain-containing protein [Dehalococcoidia bacterium]
MTIEEIQQGFIKGAIDVSPLLKDPIGTSHSCDIAEILDERAGEPVRGKITFTNTGQGILVQCRLTAELELTCSRCLDTFLYPMQCSIEEEFFSTDDDAGDLTTSQPEDFTGFTLNDNRLLDLGELICQYILLNLPMKLLCKPDCTGIRR